jgi:hypothetical protein
MRIGSGLLRSTIDRVRAVRRTARGRRRLARGDVRGAVDALESALRARCDHFPALLHLARAHLRQRDLYGAHRTLARAREASPRRFEAAAGRWLAREGFDLALLCQGPPAPRPAAPRAAVPSATAAPRHGRAGAADLRFGDCRDVDEYARFRAMPPIGRDEVEGTDWDEVLADLLED